MAFKRSAVRSRLSPPGTLERLDFLGNQAFFVTKIKYWDDAGSFHRHSSILPPRKGRFHVPLKIVKAAFFVAQKCVSL